MKRKSSAQWKGSGLEGKGIMNSISGALNNIPYSFFARFKNEDSKLGTNPEELIAAAHAGCFSMALAFELSNAGFVPTEIKTDATLIIDAVTDGFEIKSIHLDVVGNVPEISSAKFLELAEIAKKNCPVSKLLKSIQISMTAMLV